MSFPDTIVLTPGEIMRSGTVQVAPLGTRGSVRDGRIFRYCKSGGIITPGMPVQCELPAQSGAAPSISWSPLLATFNTTIGTTWQTWNVQMSLVGDTALAADMFKEGYLFVGDSGLPTGIGQMWKIKTHTGITASSTEGIYFTIEDNEYPETAFTTDVAIGMVKNAYDDVIEVVGTGIATSTVLGICPCTVASGDYFWVQTWGRGVALVGDVTTAGAPLICTTDAATSGLGVGDSGTSFTLNQPVAIAPCVIPTGAYGIVDIKVNP